MKFPGKFQALLLATLALAACAPEKKESKILTPEPAPAEENYPSDEAQNSGKIFFDGKLNGFERGALVSALALLDAENPLADSDRRLLSLMKLNSGESGQIRAWLEERVQYIVSGRTTVDKIGRMPDGHVFENPGIFPPIYLKARGGASAAAEKESKVVMENIGATIYLDCKRNGVLLKILADGIGPIPFSSPRAGVLRMGDGFLKAVSPASPEAAKRFQLSTLIHEARHSDGNKESTGFLHHPCPVGHTYAKQPACDDSLNGPYTLDALATKSLLKSCTKCSEKELSILRLQYLDYESRVLPDANSNFDDRPEGRRQ